MDKKTELSKYILDAIAAQEVFFTGTCSGVAKDGTVNVRRENGNSVNAIAANITTSGNCVVFKVEGEYYAFSTVKTEVSNETVIVNRKKKARPIDNNVKFIVWSSGYTNIETVFLAVDFFSGITNRSASRWKKGFSSQQEMPNLTGLKLFYVPMPSRILTTLEQKKLKFFQETGGVTFVTGEHSGFSGARQNANAIMSLLGSPLRCIDNESSYYNETLNYRYPATFKDISILYGRASCRIDGGVSISVIPISQGSPGTNVVWIAYDSDSRTILSGDINWAADGTPLDGHDNAKFAKSLLNLRW